MHHYHANCCIALCLLFMANVLCLLRNNAVRVANYKYLGLNTVFFSGCTEYHA